MKKKLYLLLPVALLLLTSSGYAAQTNDIVHKIRILKNTIHTRSLTDVPEAYISNDVLNVSFDGSGMYSLYIEDRFGVTVYSSALPANGMEYDYDLSGIGEGLFRGYYFSAQFDTNKGPVTRADETGSMSNSQADHYYQYKLNMNINISPR